MQLKLNCPKIDLLKAAKHFKPAIPKHQTAANNFILEFNFKINCIELSTIGASYTIYCKTEGVAKVSMPIKYFSAILKDCKSDIFEATFEEGKMFFDGITIKNPVIKISHPENIEKINLPINFSEREFLLLRIKYSEETLAFNNLLPELIQQEKAKDNRIQKAQTILAPLGISFIQLKEFVDNVIYTD